MSGPQQSAFDLTSTYIQLRDGPDAIPVPVGKDFRAGIAERTESARGPAGYGATNAGWEGSVVVDKIKNNKGPFGFNASSDEFEDLMKAGIMDPTKVVRTALQNAASVASLLFTTECMVAEKPEEKGQRRYAGWDASGRHDAIAQASTRLRVRSGT